MFARFKMNVQRYPRTFVVICLALAGTLLVQYGVGRGVGIDAKRVTLNILALTGVALVIDALVYKFWFMADYSRMNVFLSVLNTIEGRPTYSGYASSDENESEEEQGCGDPDCTACNPPNLINDEEGQDVAEYAVMLAVILVIAIGTVRLVGGSASTVFSQIGSKIGGQ